MGWPPGIARAFLFEARVEELRDPVFVKDIFADLDSVAPDVDYTHGIGGVPVDISLGTAAHDAAVQRVASVLPALRLADLAAVAMVIRSMLTARDGRAPAFVEQLDEVIHGLPRVDPGSEDAIHLSAATGRMSWLLSAQDRIAGRDRVVEKLAAAHEEAHTIEDEQLGDDTP